MQKPAALVPLKNIFLYGLPRSLFTTWSEAEQAIASSDIRVTWADGEVFVCHFPPLVDHVRRSLEFIAGRWRPADMSEDEHRRFLAETERSAPGKTAWAAKLLDGYDLGGAS